MRPKLALLLLAMSIAGPAVLPEAGSTVIAATWRASKPSLPSLVEAVASPGELREDRFDRPPDSPTDSTPPPSAPPPPSAAPPAPGGCVNVDVGSKAVCITPGSGQEFRDTLSGGGTCSYCPAMVVLPPGSFMMGADRSDRDSVDHEGPAHRVTIRYAYAVARTEVTFDQYMTCLRERGCDHDPDDAGFGRGNRPVINVSWDHAKQFITWLSRRTGKTYRLLTEAEWEHAIRAGSTSRFYFGDRDLDLCRHGNIADRAAKRTYSNWTITDCDDRFANTSPVGSYPANRWGLYDMIGNVSEWVEDCWNSSYRGAPIDGSAWLSGDCSRRVTRGGNYAGFPIAFRSVTRAIQISGDVVNQRGMRRTDVGFRVARSLPR